MADFNYDEKAIAKACMELPFRPPGGATRDEAECKPGNAVKSCERRPNGFPKYFGRLVSYGDTCVVVDPPGRTPGSRPFVWTGTRDEYHRMWDID